MFKYLMLRNILKLLIYWYFILRSPTGAVIEAVIVGGDGRRSDLTTGLLATTARGFGCNSDVGNL